MIVPVVFEVFGNPSPQAGTKTVPTRLKDGRTVYRKITEGGVDLKSWRQEVSTKAHEQAETVGMLTGPLMLEIRFRFQMPASRPQWGKSQGAMLKVTAPDTDKLVRAIGDSLKAGGLIKDDALIAIVKVSKVEVWEAWTGAAIRLSVLDQRTFWELLP